jgi:hypothetical protein
MSDELPLTTQIPTPPEPPPADAKALRTGSIGKLLDAAYMGASTLKLKPEEIKKLREDFADTEIEIRPHDGIITSGTWRYRAVVGGVRSRRVAEICRGASCATMQMKSRLTRW